MHLRIQELVKQADGFIILLLSEVLGHRVDDLLGCLLQLMDLGLHAINATAILLANTRALSLAPAPLVLVIRVLSLEPPLCFGGRIQVSPGAAHRRGGLDQVPCSRVFGGIHSCLVGAGFFG